MSCHGIWSIPALQRKTLILGIALHPEGDAKQRGGCVFKEAYSTGVPGQGNADERAPSGTSSLSYTTLRHGWAVPRKGLAEMLYDTSYSIYLSHGYIVKAPLTGPTNLPRATRRWYHSLWERGGDGTRRPMLRSLRSLYFFTLIHPLTISL